MSFLELNWYYLFGHLILELNENLKDTIRFLVRQPFGRLLQVKDGFDFCTEIDHLIFNEINELLNILIIYVVSAST